MFKIIKYACENNYSFTFVWLIFSHMFYSCISGLCKVRQIKVLCRILYIYRYISLKFGWRCSAKKQMSQPQIKEQSLKQTCETSNQKTVDNEVRKIQQKKSLLKSEFILDRADAYRDSKGQYLPASQENSQNPSSNSSLEVKNKYILDAALQQKKNSILLQQLQLRNIQMMHLKKKLRQQQIHNDKLWLELQQANITIRKLSREMTQINQQGKTRSPSHRQSFYKYQDTGMKFPSEIYQQRQRNLQLDYFHNVYEQLDNIRSIKAEKTNKQLLYHQRQLQRQVAQIHKQKAAKQITELEQKVDYIIQLNCYLSKANKRLSEENQKLQKKCGEQQKIIKQKATQIQNLCWQLNNIFQFMNLCKFSYNSCIESRVKAVKGQPNQSVSMQQGMAQERSDIIQTQSEEETTDFEIMQEPQQPVKTVEIEIQEQSRQKQQIACQKQIQKEYEYL